MKYEPNQTVYIVTNNYRVTAATVIRSSGSFYTLRLETGAATRLGEHRIFATAEEADAALPEQYRKQHSKSESGRFHYNPHNDNH